MLTALHRLPAAYDRRRQRVVVVRVAVAHVAAVEEQRVLQHGAVAVRHFRELVEELRELLRVEGLNLGQALQLALLVIVFTIIAYVSFLVVKAYQFQLKNAVDKVMTLNNNLHSLISSFTDMVFEFDENKRCINVWYNELIERATDPKSVVGKTLDQVLPPAKAKKYIDQAGGVEAIRKRYGFYSR